MIHKSSTKHQKIKQLIFTDGNEIFIYPLDKEGRNITKMDRAKRKNYKKSAQPSPNEEKKVNTSVSSSESQVDSQISSPETDFKHSISYFEEMTGTYNPNIFESTLNNFEVRIQNLNMDKDSNNLDNDIYWNPITSPNLQILGEEQNLFELPTLDTHYDNIVPSLDDHLDQKFEPIIL